MRNRFERYQWFIIPYFLVFLVFSIEILLSLSQFIRHKGEVKPYYVTPVLRPLVRLFVKDDYVPRTLSMYEWPWDYKTDRARPGYYPNQLDEKLPPYTINSFGLRGKEFQIPKPKDTFRIVIYGGSTTFGSDSSDDQTYPAHVEQILRQRTGSKNIEVINYGAHSKSLYWIAQQYFREVDKIGPDIVIINSIRNTYFDQSQKWTLYSDIVTPQRAWMTKIHLFLTDNLLIYRTLRRGIEKIQLTRAFKPVIKDGIDGALAVSGISKTPLRDFFEKQYPEVIEGIYIDAKKRGATLMMILEPIWCQPGEEGDSSCGYGNFNYEQRIPRYYESFREAIKKVQDKHPGLLILDPIEEMVRLAQKERNNKAVFVDSIHLTPKGNALFADIITKKLLEEKAIPAK